MITPIQPLTGVAPVAAAPSAPASFGRLITDGLNGVSDKLNVADAAVKAFALDDSIPVHQVTFALTQAQLSFELMLQVRNRLTDAYQEFSRMQL